MVSTQLSLEECPEVRSQRVAFSAGQEPSEYHQSEPLGATSHLIAPHGPFPQNSLFPLFSSVDASQQTDSDASVPPPILSWATLHPGGSWHKLFPPPSCAIIWTPAFPSCTLMKQFGFFGPHTFHSLASNRKFSDLSVVCSIFPKTSGKNDMASRSCW